jgi:hypothetical protein
MNPYEPPKNASTLLRRTIKPRGRQLRDELLHEVAAATLINLLWVVPVTVYVFTSCKW